MGWPLKTRREGVARVFLGGPLKVAAGSEGELEIEAKNIRELLTQLGDAHPALKPMIEKGVAVSIDGQIYRDAWYQPIPPGSEVFILMPMAGG